MPLMNKRYRTSSGRYAAAPRRVMGAMGRYARRGLIPRGIAARVHTFKRVGDPMVISSSATVGTAPALINAAGSGAVPYLQIGSLAPGFVTFTQQFGGAFAFQLAQCAQVAEITQLFDNYRIKRVVLRFDYSFNNAPGVGGSGAGTVYSNAVPLIHFAPDYDDNSIPTARNDVLANSYVKSYRLDKGFTVSILPRAQTVVSTGTALAPSGAPAGGSLSRSTWLDNSATQIPHFGGKFWIDDFNIAQTAGACLRVTPTYYIEAKNVV